jgi:hypothetical protein
VSVVHGLPSLQSGGTQSMIVVLVVDEVLVDVVLVVDVLVDDVLVVLVVLVDEVEVVEVDVLVLVDVVLVEDVLVDVLVEVVEVELVDVELVLVLLVVLVVVRLVLVLDVVDVEVVLVLDVDVVEVDDVEVLVVGGVKRGAKAAATWDTRSWVEAAVHDRVSRPAGAFTSVLAAARMPVETRSKRSVCAAPGVRLVIGLPEPTQSKIQALPVRVVMSVEMKEFEAPLPLAAVASGPCGWTPRTEMPPATMAEEPVEVTETV